jgi:hypothetical protein
MKYLGACFYYQLHTLRTNKIHTHTQHISRNPIYTNGSACEEQLRRAQLLEAELLLLTEFDQLLLVNVSEQLVLSHQGIIEGLIMDMSLVR